MKPKNEALKSLSALINQDLGAIGRLSLRVEESLGDVSLLKKSYQAQSALGYTLHNIYNAYENSFEQISRTFENHIVDQAKWHTELLQKMFLEIPGVRPAVMPKSLSLFLSDLLGFRHIFRHSYEYELDPTKLMNLAHEFIKYNSIALESLKGFANKLEKGLA